MTNLNSDDASRHRSKRPHEGMRAINVLAGALEAILAPGERWVGESESRWEAGEDCVGRL